MLFVEINNKITLVTIIVIEIFYFNESLILLTTVIPQS